jgi:hypothetical protein
MATYVLPSSTDGHSPRMSAGDFDGDGRNELALLNSDGHGVEVFRLPTGRPDGATTMTHYQHRGLPMEGRAIFTGTSPTAAVLTDQPAEVLAVKELGRDLEIAGLALNRSTPYPLQEVQAQQIGSLREKDVVGTAVGRFLGAHLPTSMMMMLQQGRTVTVELYQREPDGSFNPQGIEMDRWRTQELDTPLGSSLAAVDIDRDGVDELISGRKTSPVREQYEFHIHKVMLEPAPSLEYLGRSQEVVPRGASFGGLTRVRHVSGENDRLALAYLVGYRASVDIFEAREGPELALLRTTSWRSMAGEQILGLAASRPENGRSRTLYMLARSELSRHLDIATLDEAGTIVATEAQPWPDLRNSRAVLASLE